jgi:hypothetical protein
VSLDFGELAHAGWAYVEPYDLDQVPPPVEVACLVSEAGEEQLIEAHQRKAKER